MIDAQSESPEFQVLPDNVYRLGITDQTLRERIARYAPSVVGISCLFELDEVETLHLASIVKAVSKDIVVVVGGLDAGVRYRDFLGNEDIDLVVRGDGEETFLDILDHVEQGLPLTKIPGTCARLESGEIQQNPVRAPKVPFDEYPYPARDIVPPEYYYGKSVQRQAFPLSRRYPRLLIQASRGCALRCAFCDIVAVQDKWRGHSPEYVVNEMEYFIDKYGAREFSFVDDNFMLKTDWVREICQLIVDRNLDVAIDIQAGTAVWTLGEDLIDLMIKAGVYRVLLPIESGNPETIRFIKKPVQLNKAVKMIDYCNRRGLYTHAHLIIGFPTETLDDVQTTFRWADSSGLDAVKYFVAEPLKGARMYPIYQENDWITYTSTSKRWRTEHFTLDELAQMAETEQRRYIRRRILFYMNPRNMVLYLYPKLSSPEKLRYFHKMTKFSIFNLKLETNATWREIAAARPVSQSQ